MKILDHQRLKTVIENAKDGDTQAFETLYAAFYQKVYFTAFKTLQNDADAEDVVQEVFIAVYKNIASLKEAHTFVKWLDRITRNACLSVLKHRKELLPEDELFNLEDPDDDVTPGNLYMQSEKSRLILDAIDRLSDDHRQVVMMKYFSEMKIRDIAQELEISEGTVKSRLKYSRDYLKLYLKKHRRAGLLVTMPIGTALQSGAASFPYDTARATTLLKDNFGQQFSFNRTIFKTKTKYGLGTLAIVGVILAFVTSVALGSLMPTLAPAAETVTQSSKAQSTTPTTAPNPAPADVTAPQITSSNLSGSQITITLSDTESGVNPTSLKAEAEDGSTLSAIAYDAASGVVTIPYINTTYTFYFSDNAGNIGGVLLYPQ